MENVDFNQPGVYPYRPLFLILMGCVGVWMCELVGFDPLRTFCRAATLSGVYRHVCMCKQNYKLNNPRRAFVLQWQAYRRVSVAEEF